jgi:glycerol kinase
MNIRKDLFDEYDQIDGLLESIENSGGVYFVPSFGLLEVTGTEKAGIAAGFIGLKPNTSKIEMLRAIIDSIAFSIKLKMDQALKDLNANEIKLKSIRVSGNVSRSNFLCQYLANLLNFNVERSNFSYSSSSIGAAFLAGLGSSMFANFDDLLSIRKVIHTFTPNKSKSCYNHDIARWINAINRFKSW